MFYDDHCCHCHSVGGRRHQRDPSQRAGSAAGSRPLFSSVQRGGPCGKAGLYRLLRSLSPCGRFCAGRRRRVSLPCSSQLYRGGCGGTFLPRRSVCDQAAVAPLFGMRGGGCPAGGVYPPGFSQRQDGFDPGGIGDGGHRGAEPAVPAHCPGSDGRGAVSPSGGMQGRLVGALRLSLRLGGLPGGRHSRFGRILSAP